MSNTVIRVIHNRENPFVQLNKKALWDERMSLKATGLWARCMSRPDNWSFNVKELVKKSKEGRRAIDAAIRELIECDYAVRIEHWEKSEDGKFTNGGIQYAFFEFPATQQEKDEILEEFKKSFRHCGFSNRRNGNRQNGDLLDIDDQVKQNPPQKDSPKDAPEPPPTKEEEEEIDRRMKERPSGSDEIKVKQSYLKTVLKNLRAERKLSEIVDKVIEKRKFLAKEMDMCSLNGKYFIANPYDVEVTIGSSSRKFRYDCPEREWALTGLN